MRQIVPSLALALALAVSAAAQAVDLSTNPIARGYFNVERCKNHFILSPDPCDVTQDASWVAAADMHEARAGHTATLLKDGTVLVAGGGVATAELYDPRDGSWTMTGPLSRVWGSHIAILLPSGKVLLLLNSISSNASPAAPPDNSEEIYDPATRQWTIAKGMQVPREAPTATLLDSGKVLVVGGVDAKDATVMAAESYDPETNTWAFTGLSKGPAWGHTATKLRDGRVLVVGGALDDWTASPDEKAQLYDPVSGTFTAAAGMSVARSGHQSILLDDGTVLVTGGFAKHVEGWGGPGSVASCSVGTLTFAERYDPSANSWSPAGLTSIARMAHTATLLPDNTVLLAGGIQTNGGCPDITVTALQSSEVSGENGLSWSHQSAMQSPRYGHSATLLPDGSVLVAGGRSIPNADFNLAPPLRSTEIYRAPH